MLFWVLLHPWSISITSNSPRRARLGASPSLVHLHHLKFTQTSVPCSSGCFSIPHPSPSPQIYPDERSTLVWVLLHPWSISLSPQIHPDERSTLVWVLLHFWSISLTSNSPRRAFHARLGASPSLVHLHHLKFTQTSI